jgi:hypothetical protein
MCDDAKFADVIVLMMEEDGGRWNRSGNIGGNPPSKNVT